mgnify:CR=1 FL=1
MKALLKTIEIEFKLFSRNFSSMFFTFAFPVMMLMIFGSIYGNEPSIIFGGLGTLDVTVPAYIGLIIGVTGLMSFPLSIAEYKERKIYKRFEGTPDGKRVVILSQVIVNMTMTIIGILLLIMVGILVYKINIKGNIIAVIFSTLFAIISIFSIGLFVASIAPNMKAANVISNFIYFAMIFLGGATVPIEIFPNFMKTIARTMPMYYVVDMLKNVFVGKPLTSVSLDLLVLSVMVIILISISSFLYKREY